MTNLFDEKYKFDEHNIYNARCLIIGPKDFPHTLKKVGSWIGTAKRYIGDIQQEVSDIEIDKADSQKINENEKNKDD